MGIFPLKTRGAAAIVSRPCARWRAVIRHAADANTVWEIDVARKAGALVANLPIRRGGGLALRVGYEIALRLNAVVVVSMDADGQHMPEEMEGLIAPILEGDADMVNGSRLLGEFDIRTPPGGGLS